MNIQFGERIKKRRETLGLSQAELAAKIGVDSSRLCRWERGEEPRFKALKKLAKALKLRPGDLIG